jgi:hypothetical protein
MVAKRKKTTGGTKRKLALRKTTVRDLSGRRDARGGMASPSEPSCRGCKLAK